MRRKLVNDWSVLRFRDRFAFSAANYDAIDVRLLTEVVRRRTNELVGLSEPGIVLLKVENE